ncbi:uncharacterized protein G2W53_033323 [Senna tora]|uniref:Uncharacterized protein n=1 Tax=Senna tora TaxID=362788 RepID=A0A834W7V1_9FABA|nr:uncharacterized protein G2W53_033323 [Senna tora]
MGRVQVIPALQRRERKIHISASPLMMLSQQVPIGL